MTTLPGVLAVTGFHLRVIILTATIDMVIMMDTSDLLIRELLRKWGRPLSRSQQCPRDFIPVMVTNEPAYEWVHFTFLISLELE